VSVAGKKQIVKFAPKGADSFYDAIKHRVEEYFQRENINTHANRKMRIKTAVMISLYFVPYLCMATGLLSFSTWLFFGSWLLMGLGIVGIGASVMHDSNHGSYSSNKHVNNILGNILNVLGGYSRNWKIQHNILHHTYTNLDGLDEDIDAGILLRMCPHKRRYGIHRFQHIYAWFLYSLMNLFWISVKDFRLLFRYEKNGLLRKQKVSLRKALTELTLLKVLYVAYMLVIPMLFSGFAVWEVILGFVGMHMVAGLALACIFQPAHVMESSEFPAPTDDHRIENTWAIHQLLNTTNFSPKSVVTSWFIGGLNFQIEHHLFPHVCHVHYPALSRIVSKAAAEYNLPYQVQPTFLQALWMHGRMLKELGRKG